MNFYDKLSAELEATRARGSLRELRELEPTGRLARFEGREVLNLSSNDYLGLGARAELREEFYGFLAEAPGSPRYGLSASSSRLLTGNHPGYTALETALSRMYGGRAALAFNSGYHANVGMLPALAGKGDLVLSDKLNHASIIDGMRLAEAKFKRYPHLDYERLESLLEKARGEHENIFIVTESIFSMDGDVADLKRLVELKKKYGAVLIVDEAHSVGVLGATGCGLCEQVGLTGEIDIIVGTFGKAYCSAGAYAVMEPVVRDYLVNAMRPLIFTTGLPPVVVEWSRFVLEKSIGMTSERDHLKKLGDRLRSGLTDAGFETMGDSQVVPLMVGGNDEAVALAARMREADILVFPIRPPTVPPGTARLRFSLTSALTEGDIDRVVEAL